MSYGLKVSKTGINLGTATNKDLAYSSDLDTLRVYAYGSGTVTSHFGTAQTVIITHNMGYRPAFSVYSQIYDVFTSEITAEHALLPYNDPYGGDASIQPYCGTADLRIRYGGVHAPGGTAMVFKYFIYYNQAI